MFDEPHLEILSQNGLCSSTLPRVNRDWPKISFTSFASRSRSSARHILFFARGLKRGDGDNSQMKDIVHACAKLYKEYCGKESPPERALSGILDNGQRGSALIWTSYAFIISLYEFLITEATKNLHKDQCTLDDVDKGLFWWDEYGEEIESLESLYTKLNSLIDSTSILRLQFEYIRGKVPFLLERLTVDGVLRRKLSDLGERCHDRLGDLAISEKRIDTYIKKVGHLQSNVLYVELNINFLT